MSDDQPDTVCDAHIRPFPGPEEFTCDELGVHDSHRAKIRDRAYPGSLTTLVWHESDRRTFHGEWPGDCDSCVLPLGHRGNHAP